jgi:hypothetical protein
VTFDGKTLNLDARIRDDRVIAAVEALRPGGLWRGSTDLRATWAGRTEYVTVKSVQTQTTAGRGSHVVLIAERIQPPSNRPGFVDMAVSGRTPEDLGELAVRVALLGEENPLGTSMGFMVRMTNPLLLMDGMMLPEDAVEPVSHLLLTEELVGTGRAERITSLQVGPRRGNVRAISLGWQPRKRFSSSTPKERLVQGEVVLGSSQS